MQTTGTSDDDEPDGSRETLEQSKLEEQSRWHEVNSKKHRRSSPEERSFEPNRNLTKFDLR